MSSYREFKGWLLDVSTCSNGVYLWTKTAQDRQIIKIFSAYCPEFFAVPKKHEGADLKRLYSVLKSHSAVKSVRRCEKYVKLEHHKKTEIFGVSVKQPSLFKKTIKEIENIQLFTCYNTDLPIAQMYFYVNHLFPMSRCNFTVRKKAPQHQKDANYDLVKLSLEDDNETLFYDLPPLKAVWLDITVQQRGIRPYYNEPLAYAEISVVKNQDGTDTPRADGIKKRKILIDYADEAENLLKMVELIKKLDPDIILTQGGDEFIFPYLAARASAHNLTHRFTFSRDGTPLEHCIFDLSGGSDHYMSYGVIRRRSKTQVYFTGRFHMDTTSYASLHFTEGNIPGVIEVARISRVPLQRLCRITIGGALQSIQYYYAYQLDHLIPPFKKSPEGFRSARDLLYSDRGGHIFEPLIGVFDQVVELDFSSMYPSLMANYNISSETINCDCCKDDGTGVKVPGLGFHICSKREGIISKAIALPLNKRLECKQHVRKTGDLRYEFTDIALKWVLVVSFGYLGFKNARFGKIEAHQTVCAFAREFIIRSAEIARQHGCRLIHGIVDSMWLQDTQSRSTEEFIAVTKRVAREITKSTSVNMSWDGLFDFIVFLPSQAEPDIPTLNHYWGIKNTGEKKVRGIEVRRRDIPKIVKDAQHAFMEAFQGVKSQKEFMARIPCVKQLFLRYIKRIRNGDLTKEELTIRQRISRRPEQYKVNSYQAVAARQMERSGQLATPGKNVRYIILNAEANPDFPEKKVILSDLYDEKQQQYDREKYVELLQRAFENIFPFEFPELEEFIRSEYYRNTTQTDLSNFV